MKLLERAYIFQCPHCDGTGSGTMYYYEPPHPYYNLEPSLSPFPQAHLQDGYLPCNLCKGTRVIFLTVDQIHPDNLALMGLMLEPTPVSPEESGPEVRRVTIMPRNKSER